MEITEIKQRVSILTILNHYVLKPDKNNRLCCPFHKEKTPSLQVYPESNTWTCFSSNCTAGSGDQIYKKKKKENITKHEAILKAGNMAGCIDAQPSVSYTQPCVSGISQQKQATVIL
ncbi:MAG: hypothetical protein HY738_20060, partial [Bacteroidia bacterium]|nr:hypothetical protein [Bacteroidia bacterium]